MPRIRTLKPEHRQHRKVGPLDHVTYRLWVGMILEADDDGRLVYDAEALRVLIFGYHVKVSRAIVEASTMALADAGLVCRYAVKGQEYVNFPSWDDHQKIDRKRPSLLPPCDASSIIRRSFVEGSSLIGKDLEGKGSERIGKDRTVNGRVSEHGFQDLWTVNPKKVARAEALVAYRKLAPDVVLQGDLLRAMTAQRAWPDRQGRFFPNLATWLNGRRWEDAPPTATMLTDKTAGNLNAAAQFISRMEGHHDAR